MFGSGAYKEKILDDIINILKEVKKTGSIEPVDKNKQLFLGKYSEIPALLSSVLHEFEEKNTGVSQEQIEAVQAEMSSELNEKCMHLEEQTLMVESSNDGLWYMHFPKDGNINVDTPFMWSDKFRRMLGYQDTEDFPNVLGSWSLKLHPTEHDAIFATFAASLADKTGKTPYDVTYRLKLKSGEYRWFKATGTVKRDEYGNPLMIGGSLTDIDDDVKNKFELEKALVRFNYSQNMVSDGVWSARLYDKSKNITFEETLKQLIGYGENKSNISIIDLSGVPFDVLSITVSLISRILFEYGYYYKRFRYTQNPNEKLNNDVPLLLVYEEAHKYVPNSDLSRYRASKQSIERIAKEGRKYGVTLLLSSQRPSEISETIFAQCNNFLALRLTNPNDQNYVKRLLPDTSGNLVEKMPSLKAGECILVGDAVTIPSIVHIEECDPKPSSNDIPYLDLWKTEWKELNISAIKDEWVKI